MARKKPARKMAKKKPVQKHTRHVLDGHNRAAALEVCTVQQPRVMMPKVPDRKHAGPYVIQAWMLQHQLSETPPHKVTPELIRSWISDFHNRTTYWHQVIYNNYDAFAAAYLPPDVSEVL